MSQGPRSLRQAYESLDHSKFAAELRPHYKKWSRDDGLPGRPPYNPVGMLFALLIALVKEFSFPDLVDFLRKHPEWLRILGFEGVPDETTWTKFIHRLPRECLERLLTALVHELKAKNFLKFRVIAGDGSFVPACPWDKEAAWGYARRKDDKRPLPYGKYVTSEDGTILGYGYRLHVLVDAEAEVPVAVKVTLANVNDVTMFPALFEDGKRNFDWSIVGWFLGDRGYDAGSVREPFTTYSTQVAIPGSNTPSDLPSVGLQGAAAVVYKKRTAVERCFSKLKSVFLPAGPDGRGRGVKRSERTARWLLFACLAVLLAAWMNSELGAPWGSVKASQRALG